MFLYIALLLACGLDLVQTQQTEATCSSDFGWAINTNQQSPCQVAANLGRACLNSTYSVPAITVNQIYVEPSGSQANACECNTVFYSMISACAQCQGSAPISFGQWKTNCAGPTTAYNAFPEPVPNGTSIPSWAYLNLKGDYWDYFASAGNATNGTWVSPQSGINLSVPAIVGISIGGTALAILIIFLIFLWCRQRSYHKAEDFVRYDRIEGPPRKSGGFFTTTKKVTSYRPGLNFDLVKSRTGDLVELSPPSQNRTQSTWGSVSSLVSKVYTPPTTRHESNPQTQLGHHPTSSLSSIFTRPKEVRSQGVPAGFDISEGP